MLYSSVSSFMHFQWITGRFLLLGFAPDCIAVSLKVQQSLPWERCLEGRTPYSPYLAQRLWALRSQNSPGWYLAFKFQIRMFQSPEYADNFFKICKFQIPVEFHALVGGGRIAAFRPGIFLRGFPSSAKSGMPLLKIEFPRLNREKNQGILLLLKTRK